MKRGSLVLALTVALLAGCGGGTKTVTVNDSGGGAASTTGGTGTLADAPKQPGEVIVQGDGRRNFGPYDFPAGVYTVKFQQFDPQNPNNDFRTMSSSFVVSLDRKPDVITGETKVVFNNLGPDGETQTTLPGGKFYVDVTSADHSYVVRLTPQ